MLPVRITIKKPVGEKYKNITDFTIPKFLTVNYNDSFVLLNEEPVQFTQDTIQVDAIMHQGTITQSQVYEANGDEFELIILPDQNINYNNRFISDNFFTVYVDENGDGKWKEYTETNSLFLESGLAEKYERRFTEEYGYEFKFGNNTYGKKLKPNSKVIIYYIV